MALKINSDKLMELLEDFYVLTGMRIVIFDDELKEIISYPVQPEAYCALIKKNPKSRKQCERCDINAFDRCRETGHLQMYKCHAGLIDAAAPIKDNNVILGYVMLGQILDTPDKQTAFKEIEHNLQHYETDINIFKEAFFTLSYHSNHQIKAASQIMEACACYLWLSELVSVKLERIVNKIDRFIEQHLAEQFTVYELCKELQISRSKLYEISNKCYGMGLAEYIKKTRILQAKKMLCETDFPINEVVARSGISDYNYFYKVFNQNHP
jgi:ligand-binding sensor protein